MTTPLGPDVGWPFVVLTLGVMIRDEIRWRAVHAAASALGTSAEASGLQAKANGRSLAEISRKVTNQGGTEDDTQAPV